MFRGIMGCSRSVPGLFRAVPGCSGGVPGMFRGVPGVFRGVPGCSGAVPGFTDTRFVPLCTIFISSAQAVQEFCFRIYQPPSKWVSVKPGTPPEHPRNSPEQPRNTPGTSHNTPERPRNSKEHPGTPKIVVSGQTAHELTKPKTSEDSQFFIRLLRITLRFPSISRMRRNIFEAFKNSEKNH